MPHVGWLFDWTVWWYWLVFLFSVQHKCDMNSEIKSAGTSKASNNLDRKTNKHYFKPPSNFYLFPFYWFYCYYRTLVWYVCFARIVVVPCCGMQYGRLWYSLDCLAVLQAVWLSSSRLICLVFVALWLAAANNTTMTTTTTTTCPDYTGVSSVIAAWMPNTMQRP